MAYQVVVARGIARAASSVGPFFSLDRSPGRDIIIISTYLCFLGFFLLAKKGKILESIAF